MTKRSTRPPPPNLPRVRGPKLGTLTTRRGQPSSIPPPIVGTKRPRIAFIGLGAMGAPMAARLVAAGYHVAVFNRSRGRDRALVKDGATTHGSTREAAGAADVIITMVTDAEALATVLEGPNGVLAAFAGRQGAHKPVVVDMSTIGRRAAIAAAKRVEAHGGRFVDAPVSGSVGPASRGELVALVGGAVRTVERLRPILSVLCKKIIHAGPVGQGQALKIVLNGIGAHHFIALASGLALGERAGLARDIVMEAVISGAFATPSYVGKRDKLIRRDFTPEFSLALALKDATLNEELQIETGLDLPVVRRILQEIEAAVESGLGELDLFGIENHYRK